MEKPTKKGTGRSAAKKHTNAKKDYNNSVFSMKEERNRRNAAEAKKKKRVKAGGRDGSGVKKKEDRNNAARDKKREALKITPADVKAGNAKYREAVNRGLIKTDGTPRKSGKHY